MQEISVGIRVTEEGLKFFGTEEVNALIGQGWRVLGIQAGSAIVQKTGEETFTLSGCDITVTLDR